MPQYGACVAAHTCHQTSDSLSSHKQVLSGFSVLLLTDSDIYQLPERANKSKVVHEFKRSHENKCTQNAALIEARRQQRQAEVSIKPRLPATKPWAGGEQVYRTTVTDKPWLMALLCLALRRPAILTTHQQIPFTQLRAAAVLPHL